LREISAADENDILALPLWRNHGKLAAREKQCQGHQGRRYALSDTYIEKHTQQSKNLLAVRRNRRWRLWRPATAAQKEQSGQGKNAKIAIRAGQYQKPGSS